MKLLIDALPFYRHFFCFSLSCLLIMTLFRVLGAGMLLSGSGEHFLSLFSAGLVTDIQVTGCALLIPLLLVFVMSVVPEEIAAFIRRIEYTYLVVFITLLLLSEIISFVCVYMTGCRLGDLLFDDIPWGSNLPVFLYESFTLVFLGVLAAVFMGLMIFLRFVSALMEETPRAGFLSAVLTFFLIGTVVFFSVRGSFAEETFDYRISFFSYNRISNALVPNSLYSFFESYTEHRSDPEPLSSSIPAKYIVAGIRQNTGFDYSPVYRTPSRPTMNILKSDSEGVRKNIVMIVRPSLGTEFSRVFGGRNVSSNFDRFCLSGLCLLNMYAVSRSTSANLEALTSGVIPSRNGTFMNRLRGEGFYSIVRQFNYADYDTGFIYGDRHVSGAFRSYIENSGYSRIVDYSSFDDLQYNGISGAGDEDIYRAALDVMDESYVNDRNFFCVIKTSAGSYPYDYPVSTRFPPYSYDVGDEALNALNYADQVMGDFLEKLKDRGYYEDTVVVVVPNHGIMYRDNSLIPVKSFKIPAAIAGKGIRQRFERRLLSQIDIPKTVLDLAGISAAVPMIGIDILSPPESFSGRAFLRYEGFFAYLRNDGDMGVLMPNDRKITMRYFADDAGFMPAVSNPAIEEQTLFYSVFADILLERSWYDVGPEETEIK